MPVLSDPDTLIRLTPSAYGDGVSSIADGADPVAIAQTVFAQTGDLPDPEGLSSMFVSWGQFMDHDLSLTRDASGELVNVPGLVGPLDRSVFDPDSTPREQLNEITPQIDASQIYGSTPDRTDALREFSGGLLKMGVNDLLPDTNGALMAGDSDPANPLFLSGDIRANENTGLTLLHTLFSREHNHWAERLGSENPGWTDQQIFEATRSIVEFQLQKITYAEWLPHLVGAAVDEVQTGANPDSGIATEFSTAAFRFGHTMVPTAIPGLAADGTETRSLTVRDQFFNDEAIRTGGIADLLRGQAALSAQALDTKVIDDLNFFLQSAGGVSGFSLPALNILRGRDHGIDSYVNVRAALLDDIDPATLDPADFSIITSDTTVQAELASVYDTVHDVDLWVAGLAEDKIPGTQMGITFTHIIADQFARTQAADATFGVLDPALSADIQAEVAGTTLADILNRSGETEGMQADPFTAMTRIGGTDGVDRLTGTQDADLILGNGRNDDLRGRSGDDDIQGGDGRDKLRGQDGDDRLDGGADNDVLCGHAGNDTLLGQDGDDRLNGGRDDDLLDGGAGDDRIRGGTGDDIVIGGAGLDRLVGDQGSDTFVFTAGSEVDIVKDFEAGIDRLDLTGSGLTDFADLTANSTEAGHWLIINAGSDTLMLRKVDLADLDPADITF